MKLLKTFELFKSTYMSAARELEKGHKRRSQELKKYASEKGISAFATSDSPDREWSHPFVLEGHPQLHNREDSLGKFFIVGYSEDKGYQPGYHGVRIDLMSDYGEKIQFIVVVSSMKKYTNLKLKFQGGFEVNNFAFTNRQDALQLKRFILEICKSGELENRGDVFNPKSINVNDFYTTE